MKIAKLTDGFSVAPQLSVRDVEAASAAGFRLLINNRPDGEAPDQPTSAELSAAARRLGLDYRHVPVVPGQISDEQVAAIRKALAEGQGPALAFCRSGTRSATLWALASADTMPPEEILRTAGDAGYDLSALRGRISEAASRHAGET
ncbi:TIGR01244 family sulfur transferase [Microvirga subterranea]|uniref:Uncharacterized protein (TIGR01244 family) n=1 Tax=Microvirga subterranea TaxID=186651 RepID=A0A370HHV7_9HYPH|nr:TIGR01244 family sulfur transferase [Microvirga subterranea]RDI56755.1 uncharacterized protein (TIGR01244 family) [Microvirga subterranea]